MDTLTCQIVRPDKLLYEGEATSVILAARAGELGIYPKHGAEISALGDGVMRINLPGGEQRRVVIMGGYAEIANDVLIVLATHARHGGLPARRAAEGRPRPCLLRREDSLVRPSCEGVRRLRQRQLGGLVYN